MLQVLIMANQKILRLIRSYTSKIFLDFENVANLDKLPVKGAFIVALPMKIKGGSGAPLRIVAIIPGG